jgi:hypothetical protein
VWYDDSCASLKSCAVINGSPDKDGANILRLVDLASIYYRKQTPAFKHHSAADAKEERCFSLLTKVEPHTMDLEVESNIVKTRWLVGLNLLLESHGCAVLFETEPDNPNRRMSVTATGHGHYQQANHVSTLQPLTEEHHPQPAPHPVGSSKWAEARTADGYVYYYNKITMESVWQRPAEMDEEEHKEAPPPVPQLPAVPTPEPVFEEPQLLSSLQHQSTQAQLAAAQSAPQQQQHATLSVPSSLDQRRGSHGTKHISVTCAVATCMEHRIGGRPYCAKHQKEQSFQIM